MGLEHFLGVFGLLSFLNVEGLCGVLFGIGLFLSQPSTTGFPLLSKGNLRWLSRFEKRLVHSADIGVFKGGIEAVDTCEVAFGADVDIGEAALVGALFANVHFIYV